MTFTVAQMAERYHVCDDTVLAWISDGELAAVNVSRKPGAKRKSWRITEAAMQAFELRRTPTPPAPKMRRKRQDQFVANYY